MSWKPIDSLPPVQMSPLARRIVDRLRGHPSRWPAEAFPPVPATAEALATAEQTLGFGLPPLLRELYLNLRNGTFGSGPGLLPVGGREVGNPGLCLEVQYAAMLQFGVDELEDPTLQWPQQLLPLCHWRCEIWSCTRRDGRLPDRPLRREPGVRGRLV